MKQSLVDLQRRFLVCPAGGETKDWSQHRWDLVDRWVAPEYLLAARSLTRDEARTKLLSQHIRNTIATTEADLAWLFGWPRAEIKPLIAGLVAGGQAEWVELEEWGGEVVAWKSDRIGRF